MKKIYQIVISLALVCMTSCNEENESKAILACDSTNTTFNQLYTTIVNTPPSVEEVTMDTYLHSYTFEVTSPATICQIGYRSQPTFETFPYLFEIYNNSTNTVVYSGNHTFSSANTEYVSITPVVLSVGNSYSINRIQNNSAGNALLYVGRLVSTSGGLSFPLTMGNLKITGSSFGASAGSDNYFLPYIDIVFE